MKTTQPRRGDHSHAIGRIAANVKNHRNWNLGRQGRCRGRRKSLGPWAAQIACGMIGQQDAIRAGVDLPGKLHSDRRQALSIRRVLSGLSSVPMRKFSTPK